MKIDLALKNARIFNSYYKKFIWGTIGVLDGKVLFIDKDSTIEYEAEKEIDCNWSYVIPGLIDIHMHIESSMTTPEIFTNEVKKYGVTTIVAEPHEIANVAGIKGINEFINSKGNCSIDVFYGIPSSVPSTNENLETTGAILNFEEMKEISEMEDIIAVGEVMNYRAVIKDNTLEIVKFLEYVKRERKDLVIEGHCPRLLGLDLSKFLFLGIDGDHTEHSLEEVKERYENGMFMEIQDKMVKKEIIDHIVENNLYEQTTFVTDDIMPDYFVEKGHLNNVLKNAIKLGFSLENAIYCATMTAAKRMRLFDRGAIAPGKIADIVIIDDIENLIVAKTLKNGKVIYDKNKEEDDFKGTYKFSEELYNSLKTKTLTMEDFEIEVQNNNQTVNCRVIEVNDGGTLTKEIHREVKVEDGKINIENSGLLKVMVIERYGKNNAIGKGLVTGDIIKKGAIATTYAHDCHNLLVVGDKAEDMLMASNKVIENQGGIVVVKDGEILSEIKLNIGGILSEEPMSILGEKIKNFKLVVENLEYKHYNPIMSLCTLTLPVSPDLKITDKGLINVSAGKVVDLIV
ncbi:MAG: adenine deaminase C-terminal domain-containing protein [Sarcina sp.]